MPIRPLPNRALRISRGAALTIVAVAIGCGAEFGNCDGGYEINVSVLVPPELLPQARGKTLTVQELNSVTSLTDAAGQDYALIDFQGPVTDQQPMVVRVSHLGCPNQLRMVAWVDLGGPRPDGGADAGPGRGDLVATAGPYAGDCNGPPLPAITLKLATSP